MAEKSPLKPFWAPSSPLLTTLQTQKQINNPEGRQKEYEEGSTLLERKRSKWNHRYSSARVTGECIPELEIGGIATEIPDVARHVLKVHIS